MPDYMEESVVFRLSLVGVTFSSCACSQIIELSAALKEKLKTFFPSSSTSSSAGFITELKVPGFYNTTINVI